MGFKKPVAKKKKKKQKSSTDKEWAFEGGQTLQASGETRNQPVMEGGRLRRQTQDRDERLRRGRQKINIRKDKEKIRAKLSKKVLFSEIDDATSKCSRPAKRVRKEPHVSTNPMPIYERLQSMIASSRGEEYGEKSASESEPDDSEEEHIDEMPESESESESEVAHSIENEDISHDANVNLVGYFDWFFSSDGSGDAVDTTQKKLDVLLDSKKNAGGSIGGWLHPSISPPSIRRVGDIPGMHKLWSNRTEERLNVCESQVLSHLCTYADLFWEIPTKKENGVEDYSSELRASLRHIAQHLMRSRSEVIANDQKIKKASTKMSKNPNPKSASKSTRQKPRGTEVEEPEDLSQLNIEEDTSNIKDSGYTRARVLVLTPFRSSALRIINEMTEILDGDSGTTVVTGLDKLEVEYGMSEQEEGDARAENKHKPEDWLAKFTGNVDDDFKMGIQINPGQGKSTGTEAGKSPLVRLYSDFLMSDLIVASPLGLRLALEKGDGGEEKAASDFLSSIEIILISQADVMLMQNWDHMEFVLRMCNRLPRADHDTDFSRIRPYFLDGRAAEHRQMIMLSPFQDPSLQAVMRECAKSRAGSVRARRDRHEGCLSAVASRVKQIFNVIPVSSLVSEDDDRFHYFCESVLTKLLRLKQSHTLIVTPSYLSYVRVRNELLKREANAAFVCEYSRESEISRGRSQFFHGIRDIMLYSGRAHFFRRFRMRGALHLIFYSLPEYTQFYPEIVNNLGEGGAHGTVTSCLVLCTKYEKLALERIVGTKRCAHMLSSGKTTFMFI